MYTIRDALSEYLHNSREIKNNREKEKQLGNNKNKNKKLLDKYTKVVFLVFFIFIYFLPRKNIHSILEYLSLVPALNSQNICIRNVYIVNLVDTYHRSIFKISCSLKSNVMWALCDVWSDKWKNSTAELSLTTVYFPFVPSYAIMDKKPNLCFRVMRFTEICERFRFV
jgi:hypothetical protein